MSFSAQLSLNGNKYRILHVEYEFRQPVDHQNEPSGLPQGGMINLIIESSKNNDAIEWMLSPSMQKNGELIFNRRDVKSDMKKVSFSDAYCIYYKEVFDHTNDAPMVIHLTLSAREIKVNNSFVLTRSWLGGSKSGSSSAASPPPTQSDKEIKPFIAD